MRVSLPALVLPIALSSALIAAEKPRLYTEKLDVNVPHISTDKSVKFDYDIVYVRAKRAGDVIHKRYYTDFSQPVTMEPGADLMLLHPDGSEELLVKGGDGAITDPMVSFDGEWVYYSHIYFLKKRNQWNPPSQGADIFKLHLKSRKIVRLTNQKFTPNTGAANWSSDYRSRERGKTYFDYGVYNMGPCPLPGGKIAFTSNRDGFKPAKGYPAIALQLFVMDDRDTSIGESETPRNLEKIGHFNISGALHPVVLKDGRIMFSTLESQGIRSRISWGIWTIHPDGTNWAPLVSAFDPGGASNGFHFQTQLSDGSLVVEEYYNQNNSGFGAYIKLPPTPPKGKSQFGPGYMRDPRNKPWRYGRFYNAKPQWYRMPFMPTGSVSLTPFSHGREGPANPSVYTDKKSPAVGKFTHPSGAPDNHLLTIYSPGPVNHQYKHLPQLDGGIYLIKNGEVINEPAEMRLIKNDPKYNESWPRAVVSYSRIYGVKEPKFLKPLANDGTLSKHLPPGTPFGLVGTSSFYKRESYPNGVVPPGKVTAEAPEIVKHRDPWKGLDAFTSHGNGMPLNWHNQGGDAGLYKNSDIVAVRILAMEPTTDRHRGANNGRRFYSHAMERLRILGEIPLRKFPPGERRAPARRGDAQNRSRNPGGSPEEPRDPDGNPDTSFLAKIPADTAFTFQTIDKDGMVLNMSQTWHQLRPGEVRHDCGGCHAHSQQPTLFKDTLAAKPNYKIWDLTNSTPLLTSKARGSHAAGSQQWNAENTVGLKRAKSEIVNVEYFRDIKPILERSCVACHKKASENFAGQLALDADGEQIQYRHDGKFPGTYYRLALDEPAKFGQKPFGYKSYGYPNASRYIRKFQSRRSLLVWKIFGKRLDGFSNDDHPSPVRQGDKLVLLKAGKPVDEKRFRARWDLDFRGSIMPPTSAVKEGKVKPLTDEDRRTIVRWIDLGCPIDRDYDPAKPQAMGSGWMLDDNRPILTIASPKPGWNKSLDRILIGMHDYYSGIDPKSLRVTANFEIAGVKAGGNLAALFQPKSRGVREMKFNQPLRPRKSARLTVTVRDKQGNIRRIERTFSVGE